MFSGIAGFEKGIEDATIESNRKQQEVSALGTDPSSIISEISEPIQSPIWRNNTCIGFSEIDKYASAIYRYHYPEHRNYGDATRIVPEELPDFDCIVGGFPCQSFSVAGKREAFSDIRGTLFFEICRIARIKRPAYLWLENVKGLLSAPYTEQVETWDEEDFDANGELTTTAKRNHKPVPGTKGWVFLTILNTLWELGYDVQWQLLNSKYHGVPQNRERVFIIANLGNGCRPKVFPIGEIGRWDNESQPDNTETQTSRTISSRFRKGVGNTESRIIDVLVDVSQGQRIRNIGGLAQTLGGNGGGQGAKTGLYAIPILTPDRPTGRQNGRKWKNGDEPMFTLTGMDKQGVILPEVSNAVDPDGYLRSGARPRDENSKTQLLPIGYRRIRWLTPIECERLQGFPDNWTKYGIFENGETKEISDSQRYKCCGNAVTTNVIRDIVLAWNVSTPSTEQYRPRERVR